MEYQESIEEVREKFEQWRLTRKSRREHIPASLWQSAAMLTKDHSINVVAKALRLNGCDLKKQIQKYGNPPVQSTPPSDFMELTCALPSLSPTECIIELADPAGSRMRIAVKGNHNMDVPGLIQSFWEKSK